MALRWVYIPREAGPLDSKNAANFKWYIQYTLKVETSFHRNWGPPAGLTGRDGTYYSFFPPEGSQDFYRDQMSIPLQFNSMQNLDAVPYPAGTTVYIGPSSAQFGYGGGGIQVYIPHP